MAALFTHKKMCCHHPLKHLVHGGFSRVGGSSGSNIYKTPEKEGLLVFVLNLNSEQETYSLSCKVPAAFSKSAGGASGWQTGISCPHEQEQEVPEGKTCSGRL